MLRDIAFTLSVAHEDEVDREHETEGNVPLHRTTFSEFSRQW